MPEKEIIEAPEDIVTRGSGSPACKTQLKYI